MGTLESLLDSEDERVKMAAALARVRRLLKLPGVQVNIAAAGGQQVNVQS